LRRVVLYIGVFSLQSTVTTRFLYAYLLGLRMYYEQALIPGKGNYPDSKTRGRSRWNSCKNRSMHST